MGNDGNDGVKREGNKLYAATGLGWDNPQDGWHHCPPGMGLYNKVFVEERNIVHISDIFVRPALKDKCAEVWVDVNNASYGQYDVRLYLGFACSAYL